MISEEQLAEWEKQGPNDIATEWAGCARELHDRQQTLIEEVRRLRRAEPWEQRRVAFFEALGRLSDRHRIRIVHCDDAAWTLRDEDTGEDHVW